MTCGCTDVTAATELMHGVLDGEASDAQARQLQQLLAGDAQLREEYDALQGLFSALRQVPQREPPAGLAASVISALDARQISLQPQHQLSSRPRVISATPRESISRNSINTWLNGLVTNFLRSIDMSNQQTPSTFGNRKLWIGGAMAAVAVIVVAQFGFDGKTSAKDTIGTIAPADRYRAPQATAADVNVGTPNSGQNTQTNPTVQADAAQNASAQNASAQNASAQNASAQNASAQNASAQNASAQNASAQNASAQNASAQNASAQNASAQNASAQNAAAQNAAAQNAAAQNAAAKNAAAQSTATK